MADYMNDGNYSESEQLDQPVPANGEGMELAIVGMAGRFPGAKNLDEFWQNLCNGVESISFFSDEEVEAAGVAPALLKDAHYVKAGGVLEDAELFDASLFGVYPKEAAIMDPQHRIFLEVAWEALENAGYNPENFPGWIGLFAGSGMNSYLIFNLIPNREVMDTVHGYQLTISNDKDFMPTRVSYKLNMRGPSVNVQTACSTSLVATHLACQSLLSYQCDMALAGGVSVRLPQKSGYMYQEGGIASPDGHCRAFDARANGTVGGNGAGIVVIKRLADAVRDGDHIRAVIKGSAINNDGSLKVGYTAPSIDGQAEVIAMAQAVANINPASVSYIETHGTGTALGDPIEIAALTQVFRASTDETGFCAIGSVKTNVGHLDAAAGVTSLIKATLALENRIIPPSLHYERPNPGIDFENSPFYVNSRLRAWETDRHPRRAGVSSFGIGGTNAHLILEEAPQIEPSTSPVDRAESNGEAFTGIEQVGRNWKLIPISAKSQAALEVATERLLSHINSETKIDLANVAYTLQVGRKPFNQRRFVLAQTLADAARALEDKDSPWVLTSNGGGGGVKGHPPVVFMFSGQGAQYVDMAYDLYLSEPVFKEQVDFCAELLQDALGLDLRTVIFSQISPNPPNVGANRAHTGRGKPEIESAAHVLMQTHVTQPALFVIEYALAQLLISWGITPQAMIGHSIGEYVAACLAGVFSLEDALRLVAARGRLMQNLPGGAMISVPLTEEEARPYLTPDLALAAVNAPNLCVISGSPDAIESLISRLANDSIEYRRLRTSHAFHSPMMEPILEEFQAEFSQLDLQNPEIPFISNVSGTWITNEQATDPAYWARHLRQTVRFAQGIGELLKDSAWVFLEVGPGQTLVTLVKTTLIASEIENQAQKMAARERIILPTIRHPQTQQSDAGFLLNTIGRLWLSGVEIDWQGYNAGRQLHRLPLPAYPFQRQRYWIEPDFPISRLHDLAGGLLETNARRGVENYPANKRLVKNPEIKDWFYQPSWKRVNLPAVELTELAARRWIIFAPEPEAVDRWIDRSLLGEINVVFPGATYHRLASGEYNVNPAAPEEFAQLFDQLQSDGHLPDQILYLWDDGFFGLLHLVQGLDQSGVSHDIRISVITSGAQDVSGSEELLPEHAPVIGLGIVISQEYPHLDVRMIDLISEEWQQHMVRDKNQLMAELLGEHTERVVAYRGRRRWVQTYEPIDESDLIRPYAGVLKQSGVYLISGGLGRIGMVFAEHLARKYQARLTLLDRLDFPARSDWSSWLDAHGGDDPISQRIERLLSFESDGGKVMVLKADASDLSAVQDALRKTLSEYGGLNGVIHAAGLVGDAAIKSISETHLSQVDAHFKPKVIGAQVLAQAIESEVHANGFGLDFVFLQSSLSAVLGGIGLGAYAAANLYMDAFAARLNRSVTTPWISVDWDGWRFGEEAAATTMAELTITPQEGILAFEHALKLALLDGANNMPSGLVISTADLDARLTRWVLGSKHVSQDDVGDEGASPDIEREGQAGGFPRPRLQTAYVAPRNELEAQTAEMWQRVLGIDQIGVNDDFFELGGHSLLATQLITRLRDTFKVELPLRRLFETPTVAGLVSLIEETRALDITAAGVAVGAGPVDTNMMGAGAGITVLEASMNRKDGELPLSFGQQRLWFIDQFEPGSPLYNNFAALRLQGALDVEGLRFCIQRIIARHESLRTTFKEVDGSPVQLIHPEMVIPLELVDLQGLPENEQQEQISRLAADEAGKPFDLSQGPLLRVNLLRTHPDEYVIFMTMHHIVSDGWSVAVLVREVAAFYSAFTAAKAGQLPTSVDLENILPPLPIQYVDYAAWQRAWMQGEVLESQLTYWQEKLANQQNLEIFTDRPRPAVQTWHGANLWFELPDELSERLAELSQREGVTLFMTLVAALQTLLMRYTGQEDISIGTPIANRTRSELESLIGFLLNTLVLRSDLSGDPTFLDLLGRVRETALGAYAHQDIPFEMLVEALQPGRDMSRAPFFQVIFDLQVAPLRELELPGLTISQIPMESGTAKFDLALSMEDTPTSNRQGSSHRLCGFLNYNTDLFNRQTIERLLEHFQVLLQGIVDHPELPLLQQPLITDAEKERLLIDFNRTRAPQPPAAFIHRLIQEQASQRPEAVALLMGGNSYPPRRDARSRLTYGELERQSNQLANYLKKIGVGPDRIVGVSLERSLDMIVALLGILKAGGAFLPLDPAYPAERLAFMLEDSQAEVVLTHARLLSEQNGALGEMFTSRLDADHLIRIDADWELIAQASETGPDDQDLDEDHLAYVIYTSGSTGKPKGVMISHTAISNHCREMVRRFEVESSDHVLQFASLNFDAGLEQVFTTLMSGAQLVLRDNDVWPAEEFHRKIIEFDLTIVNVPPAYWHPWVQYAAGLIPQAGIAETGDGRIQWPRLKLVIIGGDVMLGDSLDLWRQTPLNQARLLNAYGPTETTITATTYEVPRQASAQDNGYARIPIGRPHANRTSYLLDRVGNPVPLGVPGELYLGGSGLARGYLKRPELTREKFVPDPFAAELRLATGALLDLQADDRLYRTGDLARYMPDGTLDFLGRVDEQVKLRGFRIELGEIEATLGSHPAVADAAVILTSGIQRGDELAASDPEKRLIAYYILASEEIRPGSPVVDAKELYGFLAERIPPYMIPSAFIRLDALPMTPSGKVDRRQLAMMPTPEESAIGGAQRQIVPPRTPLEREIAIIWADLLGLTWSDEQPQVGIHDNFFEMGGHSLLATRIVSRLRETYQVDLPLRRMFETPTIAGIAAIIAESLVEEEMLEDHGDLDALLAELEGLSDEEVRQMLAGEISEES